MNKKFIMRSLFALVAMLLVSLFAISCSADDAGLQNGDGIYASGLGHESLLASTDLFNSQKEAFAAKITEGELVTLAQNKVTVFKEIRLGTSYTGAAQSANSLTDWFYSDLGKTSVEYNASSTATTDVVVFGKVDAVALSVTLADSLAQYSGYTYAWGIAYQDGVLVINASSKSAFSDPGALFFDVESALAVLAEDGKLELKNGFSFICTMTDAEYAAALELKIEEDAIKAEEERLAKIEAIKNALNTEFKDSHFDPDGLGITENMELESGKRYDEPDVYPPRGEHPRVLFTSDKVDSIRASIQSPENRTYYQKLLDLAAREVDGKLPAAVEVTSGRRGIHNYDTSMLGVIQAKAFLYAIEGNELYGYQAVYAIMNYIKTLDIKYIYSDQTREFGYVMYIAACVYDWCYDLISKDNLERISLGIEHLICRGKVEMYSQAAAGGVKMEVGFPPTSQGSVTGHGSERQILRDYLAYSIAVYDELPNWYEFVAGRIYEQFIPVREVFYEAGMYPQGTITYVSGRFYSDMACATLIYGFTGESPFSSKQKDVITSWASHITENLRYFPTGDGSSTGTSSVSGLLGHTAFMAAYLYNDEMCYNIATNMGLGYYNNGGALTGISVTEMLIMNVNTADFGKYENTKEELPTILYNGGYLGQYITRNNWSDDAAITFVKANVRTTANHDHDDSGTFQIYYKELLTGDTGAYDSYGSDHWTYFHQATVSHNGILIVNPARASGYYSGSQVGNTSETGSLSGWLSSTYERASVVGNAHGYAQGGTSKFSYLKSDISKSYGSDQASYVARTTLTAYTDNEDFPMVFFVLDRIDATNTDRIKKFLLQVPGSEAPTVSGNTVTVTRGEGKLVLTSLIGGDKIEALGGEGQNFLINGKQCAPNEATTSWGRVEISTTGNLSDVLLNVMYVTDSSNEETLTPVRVSGVDKNGETVMEGATVAGITALFATGLDPNTGAVTLKTEGEGTMTYYVGGLFEGTWKVSVDGSYAGTVYSTHTAGMVTFKAPAGAEIKIEPGADIQPDGSEKITYVTDGGELDKKADKFYFPGTELTLTTNITRGSDLFDGWYLDAAYTQKIEKITADMTGRITLYAKWSAVFANEDYSETVLDHVDKGTSAGTNGINYNSSDGATVTYKTYKRAGDGYLYFKTDRDGPSIFVKDKPSDIASMSSSKITYIFEIASTGTGDDMDILFRVRSDKVNGSYAQELNIISVQNGVLHFGYFSGEEIAELTTNFIKVAVVYDFETGTKTLYSPAIGEGNTLTDTFDPSKRIHFNNEILSARAWGAGEIKIGAIQIYEGDRSEEAYKSSLPDNRIEYPADAILPDSVNIEYTPDASTVIPTEGIYAIKDGKILRPNGWYSDALCRKQITTVPDGATGIFKVYTKWVEDDYIYYPEELGLSPEKYTPGKALPTDVTKNIGGVKVGLVGWYLDAGFTQQITNIPDNASGAVTLFAKWEEPNVISYPETVKVPNGTDLEYVAGVTKLIEDPQYYIGSKKAEFKGWYLDEAFTQPLTDGIVPAGTEGVFVVYAKWSIVVFEMKPEATDSNKENISNSGFSVKDSGLGQYATVENGRNDYIHVYMPDNSGHTITASPFNVCDAYGENDPKVFTFIMKVGANDVKNLANVTIRMRIGGTDPQTMITISEVDGKVQIKGRGTDNILVEFDKGFKEVSFVVDFDNNQIRYYVEGEHVNTWSGWSYAYENTTTFAQFRFNTAGSLDLSYFKIVLGDEPVNKVDLPENRIEFPADAIISDEVDIEYIPDGETVIPTDGIYAMADGKYMRANGWYSDALCTDKVSTVPNGVTGVYKVYTRWVEDDYIYYPEELNMKPEKYVPGQALPTGVTHTLGGVEVTLAGWYLDASFSGDPITAVPDEAKGAIVLYAKWAEPSVISYPDSVKLPAGTSVDYVAGQTKLIENPEYNDSSKNAEFKGWYLDAALTQPVVDGIVPAGTEGVFVVYAKWITYVFETTIEATDSNKNSISGSGISADTARYPFELSTVENGDQDYVHIYTPQNSGDVMNINAPNVYSIFGEDDPKVMTYTYVIGYFDIENAARVGMRMRIGGTSPTEMLTLTAEDGKVVVKAKKSGTVLAECDPGLVNVSFVVDFENSEIRYYIGGEYVTTESWNYGLSGTTAMSQFRFETAGAIDIAYVGVAAGDLLA